VSRQHLPAYTKTVVALTDCRLFCAIIS